MNPIELFYKFYGSEITGSDTSSPRIKMRRYRENFGVSPKITSLLWV